MKLRKKLEKILSLKFDQGREYLSQNFVGYLKENDILSQWTPSRTTQHNAFQGGETKPWWTWFDP